MHRCYRVVDHLNLILLLAHCPLCLRMHSRRRLDHRQPLRLRLKGCEFAGIFVIWAIFVVDIYYCSEGSF
ncbi:uncharacterized protein M6B38_382145 [Iris pallida]|uniref:Uncharacterized protein n=1 Tax=Iris pallida TaxID=29817 RepID=A0AAX6G8N1_IRIPA|nr:uncharacterized protein M6B38_154790 [Iris pallida]KAJ6824561.1 uncharacterized protein M6B38_382145 [Iris pallida]